MIDNSPVSGGGGNTKGASGGKPTAPAMTHFLLLNHDSLTNLDVTLAGVEKKNYRLHVIFEKLPISNLVVTMIK